MKTELKRTPITFNGEDGFEVLYIDYDIWDEEACEYCMYEDWMGWTECAASCATVHMVLMHCLIDPSAAPACRSTSS